MSKTTQLVALLALLMTAFTASADEITINDTPVEGKTVKQIKFDREQVVVVYDDGTEDSDITSANITISPVSGVARVQVFDFTAHASQGQLKINGLDGKTAIDIFDINGRTVRHIARPGQGSTTVDISGLNAGVYVLRCGSNVIKFTVK